MEETGILENAALLSLVLPDFEPGQLFRRICSAACVLDYVVEFKVVRSAAASTTAAVAIPNFALHEIGDVPRPRGRV